MLRCDSSEADPGCSRRAYGSESIRHCGSISADLLLEELAACIKSIDLPNFHVVDSLTLTTTLIPAAAGTTGDSNDWDNEIHPNRGGYKKLADTWAVEIDRLLA